MTQTLIDKPAQWLAGQGPESASVVMSCGRLHRNLGDFPFPGRCSPEEKRSVEERTLTVLESCGLLSSGKYCALNHLDPKDGRFLAERHLVTKEFLRRDTGKGVYVSDDQSVSIMVNEEDHLRLQVLASGLQVEDVWTRLNALDDMLGASLDYAFDSRLGYLTSSIDKVGTGLKVTIVLHLPALAAMSKLIGLEQRVRAQRHVLQGAYGNLTEAPGDLFQLTNQSTLGRSEQEIVFHLRHLAAEVLTEEKSARDAMMAQNPRSVEDRVGRALGVARTARLLEFPEALKVLSALRLGTTLGLAEGISVQKLNELLVGCQNAHLELRKGHECDDLTLSTERADLFRSRFAADHV